MNIQELKQQHPEYAQIPDLDLANALHAKYYADVPKADFYHAVGLTQPGPAHRAVPRQAMGYNNRFGPRAGPMVPAPSDASPEMRFGTGVNDMLQGSTQMLLNSLPEGVVEAGNKVGGALGLATPTAQSMNQQMALREQNIQGDRANAGQSGIDWARMGGNVAGSLPLALATPAAATIPGAVAAGAASGVGTAAMQPVTDENKPYWDQKTKQMETGGAIGAALGPAGVLLGRAVNPAVNPEVQMLMDRGVTPTPGQILGGGWARTEAKLSSVPLLGDMIKNAQRRGIEQFNRATANEVLAPIGGQAPNAVGRDLVHAVDDQISHAYQAVLPNLRFRADPRFMVEVGQLRQMAAGLPEQQARRFEQIIQDQLLTKIGANGRVAPFATVDGQTFKGIESELSRMARGYRADPSFDNRQLGSAVQQLQSLLRQSLERTNPQYAPQLQAINQAFARFVRLQDAGVRAGDDQVFTAAQLQAAVKKADSSTRKGQYARGDALLQDLADAGRNVLGSKYPDSGTAGRAMAGYVLSLGLGTGGGSLGGAPVAGALAGGAAALPYTQAGGRLAAQIFARRPQFAPEIQAGLLGLTPAATAGMTIFGNGQ